MERDYARHHMEKYGIKPCPFCGGDAYLEKKHRSFVGGQTCLVALVRCVECNARSGRYKLSDYGCTATSAEARNAAIEAWNRRRPPCEEAETRVLQIKEMAFLEIAVFIETNGDLEGKGTDLFLAIPYIYAVSQNMLDGYIAFVDGNTDVYDLQAIDYGKCWRCWTARPTDKQREETPWEKNE